MHLKSFSVGSALLLFVVAAAPLCGQENKEDVDKPVDQYRILEQPISVDFGGGSIADFIREQIPKELNVFIKSDVRDMTLPSIGLHRVPVQVALDCLVPASGDVIDINVQDSVVIIGRSRDVSPTVVTVFNASRLIERFNESVLLSAISTGLALQGVETNQVQLKMHAESGLLFARGTREEVELIRAILGEMSAGLGGTGSAGGSLEVVPSLKALPPSVNTPRTR